jgi:polysaccharide biosynthesis protein PslG
VEKEKGVYDFAEWDAQMAKAQELGLTLNLVLFSHNPDLYPGKGKGEEGFQTEAEREAFARFAAAAVAHYKDYEVLWEIWNEPNTMTFWGKHGKGNTREYAAQYTALVKAVVPAMRAADPDCYIMAGSVSNYWIRSYEWTEFCLEAGILESKFDLWSVHPYGVKTPEEFADGHAIMRKLLATYGAPDMPLANTERGFAVRQPKTELEQEGWSGGAEKQAREYQAWHFVRQFMVDRLENIRFTVWYEWDGDTFGLIGGEDEARPVEVAARTMIARLDGYRVVRRVDAGDDQVYVVLLEKDDADTTLVIWTAPKNGETPDLAPSRIVQVQHGTDATITAVDLYGKPVAVEQADAACSVAVSGAPLYMRLPATATVSAAVSPPQ